MRGGPRAHKVAQNAHKVAQNAQICACDEESSVEPTEKTPEVKSAGREETGASLVSNYFLFQQLWGPFISGVISHVMLSYTKSIVDFSFPLFSTELYFSTFTKCLWNAI